MKPLSILALVMLAGCGATAAELPAPEHNNSERLEIWTDADTGCDYLIYSSSRQGGITPRLNPDGTQVCTRKETE
jgi:hypothetical protein